MGKKAKTSRKGKKAWRANISTEDTDAYFAKQAREEQSGGPLDVLPSEALFYVDKSKDTTIEKKTKKHRERLLHCESILQRNSLVKPLQEPLRRKTKRKDRDVAKPPAKDKPLPLTKLDGVKEMKELPAIWEDEDAAEGANRCKVAKRSGAKIQRVEAPAVEIDGPGCSYNPTFDDHQEALGEAVAQEMQKVYVKELEPETIPQVLTGIPLDEEDAYFLDVDDGDDDEDDESPQADGESLGSRAVKVKKLTRAELNRKARRRENLRIETEKKKLRKVKKDVQRLPEIIQDIDTERLEQERHHIRRTISREERRARGPPRLGKHKFKPEPLQVLMTEEVTGSLRKIKGCFTLARDRFKSLQRRGILEPRLLVSGKQRKKRVMYEQGTKGQKERETHAAMEAEREARKQAIAVLPL